MMFRALVLLSLSGAPDAGRERVRYHIDPCLILGQLGDAGVGGTVCTDAIPGGYVERTQWEDGRREKTTYRRLPDGGLSSTTVRWLADAGVPADW
jgi:hypothetical protein